MSRERPFCKGVVAVLLTPDGRVVAFMDELEEDGGKWESVRRGRRGLVEGWYLVGGAVEGGEDWLEALQREIREEVGGFELKIDRGRVERLGDGVEVQVRNGVVVDFWFMVLLVRLGEEDLERLMRVVSEGGKEVVLVRPGDKRLERRFRPRDAMVMKLIRLRKS